MPVVTRARNLAATHLDDVRTKTKNLRRTERNLPKMIEESHVERLLYCHLIDALLADDALEGDRHRRKRPAV